MSTVETERSQIAALTAKLDGARTELAAANKELNSLRNRVVKLEEGADVDALTESNAALKADLTEAQTQLAATGKALDKANRDLAAAGPALTLAAAVAAVKA